MARYWDNRNVVAPVIEYQEIPVDYTNDLIVKSLQDKINKYNLVQELLAK